MENKKEFTMTTMKDVAEMAGVSTATVSRALMNPEKVSTVTRQKVEQAVLAVGYSPHALSRNIKRNESRTILVIVPDISDPFFADVIQGIEHAAAQQERTFVNLIITKQIDGMLLLGSNLPFDASKEEQRNLPPMVMANEFAPELELPTVHIDNLTAAYEAVNYLHELGHKRIACIAGPESLPLSHYRLQGYIQALRRNGITVDNDYIIRGDFSYEAGAQSFAALMELPHPPTAIFSHNDVMAVGAIWQAKQLGLRIPQDVSLVGFDDLKLSQFCDPPLTTVAQPRYQIGQQAMLLLLEQLQGHSVQSGSRLLDTELIIRESTAAPKH
ncbi:DNA-binding transcriptional regulator CytR [Yersinia pestis]|uniref:DNA-binding transcriptional regulator CytR n=1 Tax=Yersinia pestis TaxID=632 RepID=UPI0009756622|nr:DNA-binding transcriptional regulator CytR [Yersinia pestis]MBI0230781.1 DNA-binding transcriptional regulator CytR [Yersinia pestis subsp. pestis]MBI0248266.1 DNA-binding transcriptional regulator CytR [Yersinia pestis subsp. pestis]OMK83877.1 DNA-binding transcriptional regulator CytR [Yersinia pestis subsp. microtus bv. Caucasica]